MLVVLSLNFSFNKKSTFFSINQLPAVGLLQHAVPLATPTPIVRYPFIPPPPQQTKV